MSLINTPIIIGIDHGYGNIKTAHFVGARTARPGFTASDKPRIASGASSPHAIRFAGFAWGPHEHSVPHKGGCPSSAVEKAVERGLRSQPAPAPGPAIERDSEEDISAALDFADSF